MTGIEISFSNGEKFKSVDNEKNKYWYTLDPTKGTLAVIHFVPAEKPSSLFGGHQDSLIRGMHLEFNDKTLDKGQLLMPLNSTYDSQRVDIQEN